MDEWIVPAICIAGLCMLAMRARAHDAARGIRYWTPARAFMVGGGAALLLGYAAIVVVLTVLEPGPDAEQVAAARLRLESAE